MRLMGAQLMGAHKFPKTYAELECWRQEGLIHFKDSDSIDRVVALILATVRRYVHGEFS